VTSIMGEREPFFTVKQRLLIADVEELVGAVRIEHAKDTHARMIQKKIAGRGLLVYLFRDGQMKTAVQDIGLVPGMIRLMVTGSNTTGRQAEASRGSIDGPEEKHSARPALRLVAVTKSCNERSSNRVFERCSCSKLRKPSILKTPGLPSRRCEMPKNAVSCTRRLISSGLCPAA